MRVLFLAHAINVVSSMNYICCHYRYYAYLIIYISISVHIYIYIYMRCLLSVSSVSLVCLLCVSCLSLLCFIVCLLAALCLLSASSQSPLSVPYMPSICLLLVFPYSVRSLLCLSLSPLYSFSCVSSFSVLCP